MTGTYPLQRQQMIYSSSLLFSRVFCVRFSPDGKYLAIGLEDGTAQIHDVNEGAKQWYDQTTLRYIRLLIVTHRSDLYADQSSGGYICSAVCFSLNSDYLATAGQDGQIRVSYRFIAMLSRLSMTFVPTFVTLELLLQRLTFYAHQN